MTTTLQSSPRRSNGLSSVGTGSPSLTQYGGDALTEGNTDETSVLSSSQPLQRVAADIADAITSPPSTSFDQPMLPFIQTIQDRTTFHVVLAALIANLKKLVKYLTQLQFFVDQPHHETSVLSSSQPLHRVAADIADAITSPPSTSLDQPMLPFIQTIQKQITRGMFLQDIVQI